MVIHPVVTEENAYYNLAVDPKVVCRMSDTRSSSDSILPKLHNLVQEPQTEIEVDPHPKSV